MTPFVRSHWILALLVAVLMSWGQVMAQTATSQVSGVVSDTSGAVVPGAQVQITNTATQAVRTAVTNDKGEYTFPNLAIGPYQLQVQKEGFQTYVQSGIELQVNVNPSIMVSLQLGSVTQQVEVSAAAAMVETQNSSVSQVINPQEVVDLPLNGRQANQLIALSGAAVNTNGGGGLIASGLDYPTTVSYSIAGSQPTATNYYLDGSQHLDFRSNVGLPMPFPDALSEFSVNISALPANLGIRPGGTVNAVTRSGTNSFHGGVFDFVRNGVMDATTRTYTNRAGATPSGVRDTLVRNQFGGTLGGPIKRDKIFFFGGYQGTMSSSTTGEALGTTPLPTPAMLSGNFSALLPSSPGSSKSAAGCSAQTINSTYAPGGNNQIAPQYLNTASAAVMKNFMSYIPASDIIDQCGDYAYQALPAYNYEGQIVGRVDWRRTASDTIFGRYFLANYSNPSYMTPGNILSSNGDGLQERIQTASIGDTYLFGAHSVNTLYLSFDRTATQRNSNPNMPTDCSLGVAATCMAPNEVYMIILEPGFQGYDYENSWGATEGFAWTGGKHQVNAGVAWLHVQMNGTGQFQMDPELTFTTGTYTGATLADAVTGNPDSLLQGMGQLSRDGQNQPSWYIQDTYKMLPRLQVTAGLRWDPFFAQHNKYGEVTDWTLGGYEAGTQSQVFTNAPPGQTFEGDAGFHGASDTNNYTKTFAPRLGFVWDVTGKGTETLRGGYGIFYDTSVIWNTMHVVLDPPFGETLQFTPLSAQQGGGLANPFSGVNGPNPFPFYNPPDNFVFPANGAFVFPESNEQAQQRTAVESGVSTADEREPAVDSQLHREQNLPCVAGNHSRPIGIPCAVWHHR